MMSRHKMAPKQKIVLKKKHDEIIDIMKYFYIGGEYKNVITQFFKFGLLDRELYLTNFDNQQKLLIS